jgi:hypothetical protein
MRFHRPLLTQQARVPWIWVIFICVAWLTIVYSGFVTQVALPLTLRRYTDDTRLIGFVSGVGGMLGIVIGPVCNYLSDRLWTRFGRRRPFLLIGGLGTFLSMALIPFSTTLAGLMILVVGSSILGDVGSTFDPLWQEIVPPAQRGMGGAMRQVAVNGACLLFFQLMFAQFDVRYEPDLGFLPPGFVVTGEQLTYLLGAGLQAVVLVILLVLVREVMPATSPGVRFRELDFHPVRFLIAFFRDVFRERRWWTVYLFNTAPMFTWAGMATFVNLMLVDQFAYDKPAIALLGLSPMVVGTLLVAPVFGALSDRMRRFPVWQWLPVSVAGFTGFVLLVRSQTGLAVDRLPSLPVMIGLNATLAVGLGSLLYAGVTLLNRRVPLPNPRLWPWILNVVCVAVWGVLTYGLIRLRAPAPPSLLEWYVVANLLAACSSGLGILAAPLLYDLLPPDRIGTLNSGIGLMSTAVWSLAPQALGFWIYYWSAWTRPGEAKDYTALYLLFIALNVAALVWMAWFIRQCATGRVVEYGRLGLNSDGRPAVRP